MSNRILLLLLLCEFYILFFIFYIRLTLSGIADRSNRIEISHSLYTPILGHAILLLKGWQHGRVHMNCQSSLFDSMCWIQRKYATIIIQLPVYVLGKSLMLQENVLTNPCYNSRASIECCRSWVRPRSCQTKDYDTGIRGVSAKHTVLRSQRKLSLSRNPITATCQHVNSCFNNLALWKSNSACLSSTQQALSSKVTCFLIP